MEMIFLKPEIVLISLFSFFLCQSPWTGQFTFEFSFFLSIAIFFLVTISSLIRLKTKQLDSGSKIRWTVSYLALLIPPLMIILLYSLRYGICSFSTGLFWFAFLPVITCLYSLSCVIFANSFQKSTRKTLLIALVPTIIFSIVTLIDLYTGPGLYFFHPVVYFPGPIYDEWIPKFSSIITYRCWILLISVWLLSYGSIPRRAWDKCILLLVLFNFRSDFGWYHSHGFIQKYLGNEMQTDHADIYFSGSTTKDVKEFSTFVNQQIEEISKRLDLPLSQKIRIYVYPDAVTKKKWTGTQYTLVGNPMQRSLHLLSMEKDPILIHELTHVVASPMGIPVLRISPKIGLLEGLATAIQKTDQDLTIHEWAKIMKMENLLPDVENSLGALSFWKGNASRMYLASGSFVDWLIDTHGVELFKKVYRGASFQKTYEVPASELIRQWQDFLETIPVDPKKVEKALVRLREKPFYQKHCVHEVADLLVKYSLCKNSGCDPYLFEACTLDIENLRLQKRCDAIRSPKSK